MAKKQFGPKDFTVGETVKIKCYSYIYTIFINTITDNNVLADYLSALNGALYTNGRFDYKDMDVSYGIQRISTPEGKVAIKPMNTQTIPVVTIPASESAVSEELEPGYYVVDWEGDLPFILSVSRIDDVLTYHSCWQDSLGKDFSIKEALVSTMKIRCRLAL